MYELINYDKSGDVWFPLHRIPEAASWTTLARDSTKYSHLCLAGQRLIFFVVGTVQDATILIRANELTPRLRVQILLARQADRAAAATLFNLGNTHGRVAESAMSTLSASTRSDAAVGIPVGGD